MNHHHGIQAEERFDLNPDKDFDPDFDEDGVERGITIGDITAVTVWQAQLAIPQQVLPKKHKEKASVLRGEQLFDDIACTNCHVPALPLESSTFIEPNPFNPAGTWNDLSQQFSWDMTKRGDKPRLKRKGKQRVSVAAYTDLKRHNLCDDEDNSDAIHFYCNEQFDQGRPEQNGHPDSEYFLTRKLWDAGSSAPYGHRGDITTLTEAILYHGGEARISRDNFANLSRADQSSIIYFLKSLQVVECGEIVRIGFCDTCRR